MYVGHPLNHEQRPRVLISSRRALGGHNFVTMTFPSAFAASAAAILVERPARRALLAVYVANEATQARTTPSARGERGG